jgi:hypothetical protein
MSSEERGMWRCLVVANRSVGGRKLADYLVGLANERGSVEVHIVMPERQLNSFDVVWDAGLALPLMADPEAELRERVAQERLDRTVSELQCVGLDVSGELGPAAPLAAVGLMLERQAYDEIVISTLPVGLSRWLHMDLPRRLQRRFALPVTTIVHEGDEDLGAAVVGSMTAAPGRVRFVARVRETAVEHPMQVLVATSDTPEGRRIVALLDQLELCCLHLVGTPSEVMAYLRGAGNYAGRAMPDLFVVPIEPIVRAGEGFAWAEIGDELDRGRRALLVIGTADTDTNRDLADRMHAWAFVPLSDDDATNRDVLELMLIELVALEHKLPIRPD